uniref:Uncharacterized protein n=1 Tax=Arundo donax TaxID=35708 RepID=A0A0A9CE38_ARUDO
MRSQTCKCSKCSRTKDAK